MLFSGSLRYNLDPFDEFMDSDIWSALEQVSIKIPIHGTCRASDIISMCLYTQINCTDLVSNLNNIATPVLIGIGVAFMSMP